MTIPGDPLRVFEQRWFLHSPWALELSSRFADGAICSVELRSNRSSPLLQNSAERTLEDALQYRLQYEAPDKLRSLYRALTFCLQICTFLSGAEGSRTHALRRAKAKKYILGRPSVSGIFHSLQVFCRITDGALSAAY